MTPSMLQVYLLLIFLRYSSEDNGDRRCLCPPGKKVDKPCSDSEPAVCSKCPDGQFKGDWNGAIACTECPDCGQDVEGQEAVLPCYPDQYNTDMCQCKEGSFLPYSTATYCTKIAEKHFCQKDYRLLNPGDRKNKPKCERCEPGTHTDGPSLNITCIPDYITKTQNITTHNKTEYPSLPVQRDSIIWIVVPTSCGILIIGSLVVYYIKNRDNSTPSCSRCATKEGALSEEVPGAVLVHGEESPFLNNIRHDDGHTMAESSNTQVRDILENWAFERHMNSIIEQSLSILVSNQDALSHRQHIAILDAEIKEDHPVFDGFRITVRDCVHDAQDTPTVSDPHGHGTLVAGLLCTMIKDLKHLVEITILKVVDKDNKVKFNYLREAYDILLSEEMADVQLICQPNGMLQNPPAHLGLTDMLRDITKKKTLICAASNEGSWQPDCIAWPARDSIAIGSHDEHAARVNSSPQGQQLHVLAPGCNIVSANARYNPEPPGSELLRVDTGTSLAATWTVGLLVHLFFQLPHRFPNLPESRMKELKTTDYVKTLLRNMAGEAFTKERGYGHLMPWDRAFVYDLKFESLIQETFKFHGIDNIYLQDNSQISALV